MNYNELNSFIINILIKSQKSYYNILKNDIHFKWKKNKLLYKKTVK